MLLSAFLCGCIPFATPPLQFAVGTGLYGEPSAAAVTVPVQVRIGAHPLGFDESLLFRRVDFAVGWLLDYSPLSKAVHGAYGEFSVVLHQTPLGAAVGRLSARAQGRFLNRLDSAQLGGGGALLLTWEYAYFTKGEFSSGKAAGYRFGEGSIGGFLEGSVTVVGPVGWAVTTGVVFRAPAMAGVFVGL